MKSVFLGLSAAILIASCNNDKGNTAESTPVDTVGMAEYQAFKAQHEKDSIEHAAALAEKNETAPSKSSGTTHHSRSSESSSGAISSESGNTAEAKKGWSKTAKGAVIGGVVGAGTGAVINKKNRTKGAIIGGAVGAGAGAIIGRDMDKKDGRVH
ncbi:YMGG-like glycine zipper-containing protein [Chitinophagaceae bacterium LB-8]|uniref:YMGG-like glycine zipper-containing protein n=1 Tax=Paraflavisolibacter caeni TaxID=2982496 RepID=A0A9X2XTK3_9BACT|nr:YMGG-like glycine zipper-containing protein [Paraflavisolibacter caeni]MCU7548989.1 YMGG-like glycine zipper-containing protein [Paraflavisolibacter caeni]